MNIKITVVGLNTSKKIKDSLERIINELEKYDYAFASDTKAIKLFSRYSKVYRDLGIISISKYIDRQDRKTKNVISLKHGYKIKKCDTHTFRVKKL